MIASETMVNLHGETAYITYVVGPVKQVEVLVPGASKPKSLELHKTPRKEPLLRQASRVF